MPGLPQLSGQETVRAFIALGWEIARQKGSYIIPAGDIILTKAGHMATLSVPDHKEVAKGTLRSLPLVA